MAVASVATLATVGACAEEDTDRPTYTASLDPSADDTQVSTLSDDDLRQVCASYASYVDAEVGFDAIAQALCLVTSIPFAADEATCNKRFDECVAGFPPPIKLRAQATGDAQCLDSLRTCSGTVAQLEGCVNVNLDFVLDILDRFSCGGNGSRDELDTAMNTLAVCADVDASCTAFTQPEGGLQ